MLSCPAARADIAKASEAMSKLSDENLSFLIEILGSDANEMSDYFSSPVQLTEERMYHIDNYGLCDDAVLHRTGIVGRAACF